MQIAAVNLRPVVYPQSVTVNENSSVAVTLSASDADNDGLTLSIVTPPAHGALSGTTSNLTYTPALNYFGPDEFTFKANDGSGDSGLAKVSIAVLRVNHPPVADATATVPLVISPNNTNATIALDGSRSSDPDGDPLQYLWFDPAATGAFATGIVSIVTLPVGTNVITLVVNDGFATGTNQITVEVVTPAQAAERLALAVTDGVPRSNPLIATFAAAIASMDRGNPAAAINQLQAFQNKVQAQVAPLDSALAAQFIQAAQDVIDALSGLAPGGEVQVKIYRAARQINGKFKMQLSASPGRIYTVEASPDLVHWATIGVARQIGDSEFDFEDTNAPSFAGRFYRVVSP
jgi:hypothetical protein